MRFSSRHVPEPGGAQARPRPIVDVVVEGLTVAPQACLIDSGATAIRMGQHVADICGIDLAGAPEAQIAVGGALVRGRMAEVTLRIADGRDAYEWVAPVWFCDPWMPAFGLLGLTGFLDQFVVTLASYEERIEVEPIA